MVVIISFKVSEDIAREIDKLISKKMFASRSEFLRFAVYLALRHIDKIIEMKDSRITIRRVSIA